MDFLKEQESIFRAVCSFTDCLIIKISPESFLICSKSSEKDVDCKKI